MNKNNLTRYTLIPIYEHNGWANNIKQEENILIYIVTKREEIKELSSLKQEEKNIYFENYDEAKKERERLNREILKQQIELLEFNQNYELNKQYLIQEHQKNLEQYQEIENLIVIEEKTKTLRKKLTK